MINELLTNFKTVPDHVALVTRDGTITYGELVSATQQWVSEIGEQELESGSVVLLKGDFSLDGISALLALIYCRAIVVLLAPTSHEKETEFRAISNASWTVDSKTRSFLIHKSTCDHPIYDTLRSEHDAGIVLFSSGSTGISKGTVHSANRLFRKFKRPGKKFRTLAFLLFDHIAGLDTMFYSLFNLSSLVLPQERAPEAVCELIEKYRVEVFPTAPSFLNLLLLSKAYEKFDLSSLKIITYGSEMMPLNTLKRCAEVLPHVRLLQKYGTSEVGAPPTRSKSNTSTWLKLGGDGFVWRERDGKLEIKADTAMLGYLNAPSPFTEDGYFQTGDRIDVDGEYVRFLGRDSDIINIGGQKVFPAEVENLITELPEIAEVSVFGSPHPILGAIVVAKVRPVRSDATLPDLRKAIRIGLSGKLEQFKIPQKVVLSSESLVTSRGKQIRNERR